MSRKVTKRNKPMQEEVSSLELTDDSKDEDDKEENPQSKRYEGKRSYELIDKAGGGDCGNYNNDYEIQKMLETIGNDFNKTNQIKKQRLEKYLIERMKIYETHIQKLRQHQAQDRRELYEEYKKKFTCDLKEWDVLQTRINEQQDKLLKIIHQLTRMIERYRSTEVQKRALIWQLHESHYKNFQKLEIRQVEDYKTDQLKLRKDIHAMQQEVMEEAQKEDMAQMKKYFENMLLM
ncbi:hypothetical protein L9F63_006528 [Diploptera punctata]|uniref:XLR/SYCP3/FAM9 domain-containing protein n=1 Tax=Diploptera punctata TaxID=6984 RepID=A0AAD8E4G4_DIPPU|nr:hypothetical protein L9F63_006528 [Diploptera punctata]